MGRLVASVAVCAEGIGRQPRRVAPVGGPDAEDARRAFAVATEKPRGIRVPAPETGHVEWGAGRLQQIEIAAVYTHRCGSERQQVPSCVKAEDVRDEQLAPVRGPARNAEVFLRIHERHLLDLWPVPAAAEGARAARRVL